MASVLGRLHGERVVHVLHIRKTGGSALKEALDRCPARPGLRIAFHRHEVRLRDIPRRDEVVFFVRDPVARYVSGFNDRLREGRPRYQSPWSAEERLAFERFPTADDLAIALYASDEQTRREARRAMRSVRNVSSRLTDWLDGPRLVEARRDGILLIGSTETMASDFSQLKACLELPSSCILPNDEAAHRAPVTQPTALSPKGVEHVRRWFAADEAMLWLCRSIQATKTPTGAR